MSYLQIMSAVENPFLRVFTTDVELSNGTITQIMNVFSIDEIGFEEVYIGIRKSLEFMPNTKTMHAKLFSINNGTLQDCGIKFKKSRIKHQYENFLN